MSKADAPWQRMPKARRAAVYRAIGRAARVARINGEPGVGEDVRIAMSVLRAHAKAPAKPKAKAKRKR
jgi:hypothetical protein